jgi:hypothetical protein
MPILVTRINILTLLAVALAGCGSGSDLPAGVGGSGFTADVDGKPWAAEPIGVTAMAGGVPGGIVVVGSQVTGAVSTSLSLSLGWITGPGTYALGVGPGVYGGSGSVGEAALGSGAANVWQTRLDGRSGSITISTLGGGRLVATFQFTGEPDRKNPLGGTRSVTSGKIDLPLRGTLPPVPENMGSKVTATLDGQAYNAWSVTGRLQDLTGGAGVAIDTISADLNVSLMLVGVTGPGSYPLSNMAPLRTLIIGHNGGDAAHCCWGLNAGGDTGSIDITSLTPSRVRGTFSGTLQPQPGKPAMAPLQVVGGTFDVGIN